MPYDVTIIGSGIVGLATACQLLWDHPEIRLLILEKEVHPVPHQSSHNSGVLHSGIYYEPGSLKAELCVQGQGEMISFCDRYDIPYAMNGKFIIAQDEEEEVRLKTILDKGRENGLDGLQWMNGDEIEEEEPDISSTAGIWVPQAGITDFESVGMKMADLVVQYGGQILYNRTVDGLETDARSARIKAGKHEYKSRIVVNCAGLYSDRIARLTHPNPPFRIIPFRGEYYKLNAKWQGRIKHLIYPCPNPDLPFLGIHLTQKLDGSVTAGPNAVLAFSREGYTKRDFNWNDFSSSIFYPGFLKLLARFGWTGMKEMRRAYFKQAFYKSVQRILPALSVQDLIPTDSGVRAQAVSRSGELIDDFLFLEKDRIIHVCNAPSPAATASLAIGRVIGQKVEERL